MHINYYSLIINFLILKNILTSSLNSITCRAPNNSTVDWYTMFLFPSKQSNFTYAYMDNKMKKYKYYTYESPYSFPPSIITNYVYSNQTSNLNYFFWNDDTTTKNGDPSTVSNSKAHSKGSLVYNKESGVFLLHSLPRFPLRDEDNNLYLEMPDNNGINGQSFLCITLDLKNVEKIEKILNYINVNINLSVKEDKVHNPPNEFTLKLINNVFSSKYPNYLITNITSKIRKKNFTFISKNHKYLVTPYDESIRDIYNDDFYVKTWTRPFYADSLCDKYKLLNVFEVNFNNNIIKKNNDHSKWAVSINKNISCFGDLNHVESQIKRGGNIVCFDNYYVSKELKKSIVSHDECLFEDYFKSIENVNETNID